MHTEDNITWCTKEEHRAMCQGVSYLYYGDRRTCDLPAEHYLGYTEYVDSGPLGFCDWHWHWIERHIKDDINVAPDDGWLMKQLMARGKALYWAALGKEQRRRRRANEVLRKELIESTIFREESYVYFIQSDETGPIKIGVTNNIMYRLSMLQTGSPYQLHIRALQPGDVSIERAYHQVFEEHRISGEWFEPVPKLLATIKAVRARHEIGVPHEQEAVAAK